MLGNQVQAITHQTDTPRLRSPRLSLALKSVERLHSKTLRKVQNQWRRNCPQLYFKRSQPNKWPAAPSLAQIYRLIQSFSQVLHFVTARRVSAQSVQHFQSICDKASRQCKPFARVWKKEPSSETMSSDSCATKQFPRWKFEFFPSTLVGSYSVWRCESDKRPQRGFEWRKHCKYLLMSLKGWPWNTQ